MKITYIGHSGFLAETQEAYLLFDCIASAEEKEGLPVRHQQYTAGVLPELDGQKELFVFVSHRHEDHYSHVIWKLKERYPFVRYVIAKDIPFTPNVRRRLGVTETDLPRILRAYGGQEYEILMKNGAVLKIETLFSTDAGVAFYVTVNGQTFYHAGDLNLWVWEEESAAYNKDMTNRFERELEKLRGRHVDAAFLPLDPRQGADAYRGMDAYLQAMRVNYVFPMHFWNRYEIISQYCEARKGEDFIAGVQNIKREGQTFVLPDAK